MAPRSISAYPLIFLLPTLLLRLLSWPQEGFPMKRSNIVLGAILGSAVFAAGVMVGQAPPPPVVSVNSTVHPNLAAAQRDILAAYNELALAQKANNNNMGNHADSAASLLDQANAQVLLAAQSVDSTVIK
jgi:hypothetical protein